MAVAGATAALVVTRWLPPAEAEPPSHGPRFPRPSRRLAALGAIAFCALLAEGAVFDWSGIFMRREAGAAVGLAPAALAAFNLAMGFGRLTADGVTERFGAAEVGRAGALVAAAGLGVAVLVAAPAGSIAGFAVMGLGLAAVFPLALRAAGYDPAISGPAVAAVSSFGYVGFLTGPPAIGLARRGARARRRARLRMRPARRRRGACKPTVNADGRGRRLTWDPLAHGSLGQSARTRRGRHHSSAGSGGCGWSSASSGSSSRS